MIGWRYYEAAADWRGRDGTLEPAAVLASPFHAVIDGRHVYDPSSVLYGPKVPPAKCWDRRAHEPPGPECRCGYRIVQDLAVCAKYMRSWDLPASASARMAFVRVKSVGRVEAGNCGDVNPTWNDPPGTYRCRRLKIVGPILLSPSESAPSSVKAFRSAFGVDVVPSDETYSRWVAGLAANR